MKKRLLISAAALMTVTITSKAHAVDFLNYCTTGAIKTCASMKVFTTPDGMGGTNVVIWVRNEQGTNPTDNTQGSLITKIGLVGPEVGTATGLTVGTDGEVGIVGDPASRWEIQASPGQGNIGGIVEFTAGTQSQGGANEGGIRGCDSSDASPTRYFVTCDGSGNTGWVTFSFNTSNLWNAENAIIAWKTQAVTDGGGSYECRADAEGEHACAPTTPVTVTPEPVSLALMGSGLLGIAMLRFRRRQGWSDDSDVPGTDA